MYLLATIAAFLVFVKGLSSIGGDNVSDKTDSNSETLENETSKGADRQHRYRIGAPYSEKVQQESYEEKQDDLKDKIKSDISYTM